MCSYLPAELALHLRDMRSPQPTICELNPRRPSLLRQTLCALPNVSRYTSVAFNGTHGRTRNHLLVQQLAPAAKIRALSLDSQSIQQLRRRKRWRCDFVLIDTLAPTADERQSVLAVADILLQLTSAAGSIVALRGTSTCAASNFYRASDFGHWVREECWSDRWATLVRSGTIVSGVCRAWNDSVPTPMSMGSRGGHVVTNDTVCAGRVEVESACTTTPSLLRGAVDVPFRLYSDSSRRRAASGPSMEQWLARAKDRHRADVCRDLGAPGGPLRNDLSTDLVVRWHVP